MINSWLVIICASKDSNARQPHHWEVICQFLHQEMFSSENWPANFDLFLLISSSGNIFFFRQLTSKSMNIAYDKEGLIISDCGFLFFAIAMIVILASFMIILLRSWTLSFADSRSGGLEEISNWRRKPSNCFWHRLHFYPLQLWWVNSKHHMNSWSLCCNQKPKI